MADKSTLYRAEIGLSDVDRNIYETLKFSIARHPSETEQRLAGRILAYLIHYHPSLRFTKGICEGETPDLWVRDPDGFIRHWIEVGLASPERLAMARRKSDRVTLLAFGQGRRRWQQMHLEKIRGIEALRVIAVAEPFIQAMAASLQRKLDGTLTLSDGEAYLSIGDLAIHTSLELLVG